jgi:hypothetical protein
LHAVTSLGEVEASGDYLERREEYAGNAIDAPNRRSRWNR